MLDSDCFQRACEWFQVLVRLDGEQRQARLEAYRRQDRECAELVAELLEADQIADEERFLAPAVAPRLGETQRMLDPGAGGSTGGDTRPESIGPYEIVSTIGQGGMGVVYEAYHPVSDRRIALKVVRSAAFLTEEHVQRFRREARAAAQLQHPHVVPVFDVGRDGNIDYFTMAWVVGENLQSKLKRGPMRSREAAVMIRKIASALMHAHAAGVIHRDVKPGNVLIDDRGEPLLTDFGLAKTLDLDDSQTRTDQILGTLNYMAPEQITDAKHAGPAADIYGLGATLYHCLTGQPPVSSQGSMMDRLQRIRETMPAQPRELCPDIDADLALVCYQCLQKDPAERYQSMAHLIRDLDHYLNGEPVESSPRTAWHSLVRQINRDDLVSEMPSASAAIWIATLTFLFHSAVFAVIASAAGNLALWAVLALWLVATQIVNYVYHWSQFWQLTPIERHSGLIQLALYLAFISLFLIHGPLTWSQPTDQFLKIYPPFTLAVAVAFMAHASIFGRLVVPSVLLFPTAIGMTLLPAIWSPLLLGVVGGAIVTWAAVILQRSIR